MKVIDLKVFFFCFFFGRFCISKSRGYRVKICNTRSRHNIRCSDNPTPAHLPASLREQTSRCRPVPRPGTLLSPERHPTAGFLLHLLTRKCCSRNSVHPGPRPEVHPGRSRRPFLNRSLNLIFLFIVIFLLNVLQPLNFRVLHINIFLSSINGKSEC